MQLKTFGLPEKQKAITLQDIPMHRRDQRWNKGMPQEKTNYKLIKLPGLIIPYRLIIPPEFVRTLLVCEVCYQNQLVRFAAMFLTADRY